MKWIVLLLAASMLTGCAQLDDAKADVEEARQKLAEAQREAQEAKERYDRVKSASVVRTERLDVIAIPRIENTTMRFEVWAMRGNVSIPRENLTAMEPLTLRIGEATLWCDPLTCEVLLPETGVDASWDEGTWAHYPGPELCVNATPPAPHTCGQAWIIGTDIEARVTTAASDITA